MFVSLCKCVVYIDVLIVNALVAVATTVVISVFCWIFRFRVESPISMRIFYPHLSMSLLERYNFFIDNVRMTLQGGKLQRSDGKDTINNNQ